MITNITNPVWADEEHTQIDCIIALEKFNNEEMPFTADPNDPSPLGREVFALLMAGQYGEIAEYVPPVVPPDPTPPSSAIPMEIL